MVFYNYVVNDVIIESKIPYDEVLRRTGLEDQVGLTEAGYVEYFEPREEFVPSKEQLISCIRSMRNSMLMQSDWTQLPDVVMLDSKKAEWIAYRLELRNMPETLKDITNMYDIIPPVRPL